MSGTVRAKRAAMSSLAFDLDQCRLAGNTDLTPFNIVNSA
jgi:hypothetical protein